MTDDDRYSSSIMMVAKRFGERSNLFPYNSMFLFLLHLKFKTSTIFIYLLIENT